MVRNQWLTFICVALTLAGALAIPQAAAAAVRPNPGFTTNTLLANDDGSTEAVNIEFTLNFFGLTFTQVFVNNNGNVTFDQPLSEFTPFDLSSTQRQIIAPFFADVDTSGPGSGLVRYGNDIVNGRPAFGVNWLGVGYFSSNVDKLNSFQLVLIDRGDRGAGDFDIEFNYDQIQWETGDASGGTDGLGGASARAGFSNGTRAPGTFLELLGSAVNGAFLDTNSLTGLRNNAQGSEVLGRYVFEARNGVVVAQQLLTVTKLGSGTGRVTSADGGIDCGADCAQLYPVTTPVDLDAVADPGSQFTGFGGDCDGAGVVVMNGSRSCTVTFVQGFTLVTLTLTLTGSGSGIVTSAPGGIACPPDCAEAYASGDLVALVPLAAAGSFVVGFGGDPGCVDGVVRLTAAVTCTVEFSTTPPPPPLRVTSLVSRGIGGTPSDGASLNPSFSADANVVAFDSTATNLTGRCTNGLSQIYLLNRATGQITCVTVTLSGAPGDGPSRLAVLSADGTILAFESSAANLVPGCATGLPQIYVFNLVTGARTCASATPEGTPGNGASQTPALSADGTIVVFVSTAMNLAPGCTTSVAQIVRIVLTTGARTCVSAGAAGAGNAPSEAPALSDDGLVIAFASGATNLTAPCTSGTSQIFVFDLATDTLTCASADTGSIAGNGPSRAPALSGDGLRLAFESSAGNLAAPCTTGISQVFVLDRATKALRCVTVNAAGQSGNGPSGDPAFSGDGRVVVFITAATNLTGAAAAQRAPGPILQIPNASAILMSDLVRSRLEQLTSGSGTVSRPEVSRDGSRVGFSSDAPDETDDDPDGGTDVFVVDLEGEPPPADRVIVLAPANGIQFPLASPTPVTFRWTALALPGLAQYGLEFTGVNRAFSNPNGTGPDAVNGFGGAGGALLSAGTGTTLDVVIPPGLPAGNYQVRLIGLNAGLQPVGVFSDAITLILGIVPIPPDARPTITTPAPNSPLALGGPVRIAWSIVPGVAQYLLEVSGPGRPFANPNGTNPDPGALGSFVIPGTVVSATVPATLLPGTYQVRVISLNAARQPVGIFSDAVTVVIQ
jgi:Tol biopolymer transport system component